MTTLQQNLNVLGFAYLVPLDFFAGADFFLIGPEYSWNTAALAWLHVPEIQSILSFVNVLYVVVSFGLLSPAYTFLAVRKAHDDSGKKALAIAAVALMPTSLIFATIW